MRGVYTVRETVTGVTAAKVLLYIATPADQCIEILSAQISTAEGTSESIHAKLSRATGSVGGGDALTPKPHEEGDAASSCTAKGGNTAITGMTADGDDDALANHANNKIGMWVYVPLPEERQTVKPSDFLLLETKNTITSSDLIASITFREIG